MSQLIPVVEVLDFCAQWMDRADLSDAERNDVRAIYLVAGQMAAADHAVSLSAQTDPRISVPDWLVPETPGLPPKPQHERSHDA